MSPVKQVPSGNNQGIWRDGKKLVVHKQATLPQICVKSNEPSQRKIKRRYYWHHPAVFLTILLNILVYVIVAMVVRKRHDLEVPVSDEVAGKRRTRIIISWAMALSSIGLGIASVAWMLQPNNVEYSAIGVIGLVLAGIILIAGSMIGSLAAGILTPKKMTETATWFAGAHREYLERFPEIPPNV